jgi:hypothetical protein
LVRLILNFGNALFIGLHGVLLALIGADDFRPGLVGLAQREIIQRLVGVQHDAVVGTALIIQLGLVGKQRSGLLPHPDLGLLGIIVNFRLRLVKRVVAVGILAGGAQHRPLLQPPDDGIFVVGILIRLDLGLGDGIGQIALLPIQNDLVFLFVGPAPRGQQASHPDQQNRRKTRFKFHAA